VAASIRLVQRAPTHDRRLHLFQRFQAEFHLVLIKNGCSQCVSESGQYVRVARTKPARPDQGASDTRIGYLLIEQAIEELMKRPALK
jgi:hypothetical protein